MRGYVDESRALARTVGAMIEQQNSLTADFAQSITENKAALIRVRNLLQMTTITSAACGITDHIVTALDDLRSQRYPTTLFTEAQNGRFMKELASSFDGMDLEPVLLEPGLLHFLPAAGLMHPINVQGSEKSDTPEAPTGKMGISSSFDDATNATTLTIKMTNRQGGSVAQREATHEDHPFTVGEAQEGVELVIVVKVPLKRRDDPGFDMLTLEPALLELSPGDWTTGEVPGKERRLRLPEVALLKHRGALLRGHGAKGASFATEVQPDFVNSCKQIGSLGPHLCWKAAKEPEVKCLTELFTIGPCRRSVYPTSRSWTQDIATWWGKITTLFKSF